MKRTIDTTTWAGLAVIALFLLISLVTSHRNVAELREYNAWVVHTQQVETELNATLGSVLSAQTNFRGFIIAGWSDQLNAYRSEVQEWPGHMAELRHLLADDRAQLIRLDSLDRAAQILFAHMEQRVEQRQAEGSSFLGRTFSNQGELRMRPVRALIGHMLNSEIALHRSRDAMARKAYRNAQLFGLLSAVVGLLLLGGFTIMVVRSVRQQRKAAERAHEQEQWFRTTLSSIGDAVIATDATGAVTFMNPVAGALTGEDQRDALGRPLGDVFRIINESTRQPMESPVAKVLEHGNVVGLANHTVLVAKDGTERPIDDSAAPIRSVDGTLVGTVMVFHDVTEQRRHASRLQASEARKTAILESALDCIISIDQSGAIIEFNPAAERTFGHRATEVIGRSLADVIIPPTYREQHVKGLSRYLATGEGRVLNRRFEITALRFDGTEFPVELAITPITGPGGTTFTAHLRDITDRKRMEQELRQTAADLSEADRRKSEFLAILAHELRNPLAPVRNSLEVIKLSTDEPAMLKHATRMMERQVVHMVRLIDDLLDVTRISRGKIELRPEPMDLGSVIEQTVEGLRATFNAREQKLSVTLPGEPILLLADPTRITQVVGNLLNNASKFTKAGGAVTVTAAREDGSAVVRVRDNGVGIAPEQLPRIFTLFTQLDASLEREQGGLGIGLTLVKWLVELHNGTIEARSEGVGKGAEFIIRLPVLDHATDHGAVRRVGHLRSDTRRVLVVDDNQDAAESLAMLLRTSGHTVDVAFDGEAAVTFAERLRPDVVLLDIGMPKLNGYEAATRIRKLPGMERALLVALTGWGQDEDRRRSEAAGFDAHLVKPVDLAQLRQMLGPAPVDGQA